MGRSRTVSETDGYFIRKSQNFPTPLYFVPLLKGFPSELSTGARGQKTRILGYWADKEVDDNFSHLDRIHQRDGRTDGRTPGDSKDRAYA